MRWSACGRYRPASCSTVPRLRPEPRRSTATLRVAIRTLENLTSWAGSSRLFNGSPPGWRRARCPGNAATSPWSHSHPGSGWSRGWRRATVTCRRRGTPTGVCSKTSNSCLRRPVRGRHFPALRLEDGAVDLLFRRLRAEAMRELRDWAQHVTTCERRRKWRSEAHSIRSRCTTRAAIQRSLVGMAAPLPRN